MQDDAIDLALVRPETRADWMRTDVPFNASFVVVAARGHPSVGHLPEGAEIPLDLFFGLDHVLRSSDGRTDGAVDLAPARLGRKRRVVLTLPQFHSFVLTAAKGLLVAALPVQYARAFAAAMGLVCHCLPNKVPAPDIFMYWHSRYPNDAAHLWMRRIVLDFVRELGFADVSVASCPRDPAT